MKFKYKYFIEIETELELPVVGYDINFAATSLTSSEVKFVLERCIQDPRPEQIFDLNTRTYKVNKGSTITVVKDTLDIPLGV